jgi:hypothetical protein
LRKWRQRFGFPLVEATADGKPAYSRKTINQLFSIKRLLENGYRPGQVVGKRAPELAKLQLTARLSVPSVSSDASTLAFIEQLKQSDLAGFESLLAKEWAKQTLFEFVERTVAPLMISVGDAWARGELDIHHEHLCTSCIERYLHAKILTLEHKPGLPRVLFALPPGEHHFLGLLMIEAVLAEQGARTINIGSDIPLNNLKLAAISCNVDVVVLSFSFAYPARDAVPTLLHLRRLLPVRIQIWAGGAGLAGIRKQPRGIRIFQNFNDSISALHALVAQDAH